MKKLGLLITTILVLVACQKNTSNEIVLPVGEAEILFNVLPADKSGIDFVNEVDELDPVTNYFSYYQIYQGAGVAVGDLNNDGLDDIFFQSTTQKGVLYANKGAMKFEKIDLPSSLFNTSAIGTGVSLIDINQDGLLDIYLCYSGPKSASPAKKRNKLLVNKGNFKFEESAATYGLDAMDNSIQASFFDFDKDGDLDMYLVNTNVDIKYSTALIDKKAFSFDHPLNIELRAQDRFFENVNGSYVDITTTSGLIPESYYGFNGAVGDYNNDSWPDIFVSNDFSSPDLLYINNQDGTFREASEEFFKHTSFYSMGADAGDFNYDGYDDLVVVDMNPEDYKRSRTTMAMTDRGTFSTMLNTGYGRQYMHNMLHLNTGKDGFREVSQFAGIDKTDWSWAVLNEDFDNDGHRDFYITNGIAREVINKDDFVRRTAFIREKKQRVTQEDFKTIIEGIPSEAISNYLYINNGDMTFANATTKAGVGEPSFSQGAAAGDFDNDGDLDLVVNNYGAPAFLMENTSATQQYIQFAFEGNDTNKNGIGAKVCIETADGTKCSTLYNSRGYMSSAMPRLHFGLGSTTGVSKATITWADGATSLLTNLPINQLNTVNYKDGQKEPQQTKEALPTIFDEITTSLESHKENYYDDYEVQVLLPHKLSDLGPAAAKGDLNADGLVDLFIGGGKDQAGVIYLQNSNGDFTKTKQEQLQKNAKFEDTDAILFDVDQDNDLDLLVVSGSYEYENGNPLLKDHLYLNDSKGNFISSTKGNLPLSNSMTITHGDIDGDGDEDVFIGGRVMKGMYPLSPKSYLLLNEQGTLVDKTKQWGVALSEIGMITDAEFADIDGDDDLDLIVVGEWMPVTLFSNNNGQFEKVITSIEEEIQGWWNTIEVADLNGDGKKDLVLGNLGLNYKFSASKANPLHIYGNDFDDNNTIDIVLAKPFLGQIVPVRGKMCSSEQIPSLGEKFPTFQSFADANLKDLYGDKLENSVHLLATTFEHQVMLNLGDWDFEIKKLPKASQMSAINDIIAEDINGDGILDLVMAGNLYGSEVETTRGDSGIGVVLIGAGDGSFKAVSHHDSGFFAAKDARKITWLPENGGKVIVVNNNDQMQVFSKTGS